MCISEASINPANEEYWGISKTFVRIWLNRLYSTEVFVH